MKKNNNCNKLSEGGESIRTKTAKQANTLPYSSAKVVTPDIALETNRTYQPSMQQDCSYLSPSWNVVEKIANYIHAIGRVNSSSGSAILIGYTYRYDFDANLEQEHEQSEEWSKEMCHSSKTMHTYSSTIEGAANRKDCNSVAHSNATNNVNKNCHNNSKTRLMGVLLTTSSVLFPEDYANALPDINNNSSVSKEEKITFLEEPVAGTAARLGFTTAPISVRLRTDCGLITSLTDDELRREERRRRDQYNHINYTNKYYSTLEELSSTMSSGDSVVSSNHEEPSSQLSPLFDLTKSSNEVDGQLNSANLNSFVSSHLHKIGSNGHMSNSGKHLNSTSDIEKDHPLVVFNEERTDAHADNNANETEMVNRSCNNENSNGTLKSAVAAKDEQSSASTYSTSDNIIKNKTNTSKMSEDSYLMSVSQLDNKNDGSNSHLTNSNDDVVSNGHNKHNNLLNSSSNASHVLCSTRNTALPLTSATHSHHSINIKANFMPTCNYTNDNILGSDSNNNNINNNNNVDAYEVLEDDAGSSEIVGYCITYCDLTPSSFAQNVGEVDSYCSSKNTGTLTEEQICRAIPPLPLPLLLSKLKPVQVGDVHMIITHVDENRRNIDHHHHNNISNSNESNTNYSNKESERNKPLKYSSTPNASSEPSSTPPPLPLKSKIIRRHKLYKVCFVSEHYCEYELTCSTDNLHWCSGGAVFDGNGSFIGLHHQEVEGRCMCLFTSSIVRHLFANNELGLCISPVSPLTRMQVANGEVQSSPFLEEEELPEEEEEEEINAFDSTCNHDKSNLEISNKYHNNLKQTDKLLEKQSETCQREQLIRQYRLRCRHRRRRRQQQLNASDNSSERVNSKCTGANEANSEELSLNDAFMMCSNNGKQLVDFTTFQRMRAHHQCVTSSLPPSFEEVYDEYYEDFHSLPHLLYAFPYCPPLVIKVLDELVKPLHNTEANMEYIALSGGVGVILELIDAYPRHTALLTSALIALAKLSVHDRCLNIFTQLDGIITLLALLHDRNELYCRHHHYSLNQKAFQFTQWAVFCLLKVCSPHAAHVESSKKIIASENNTQILCTLLTMCTWHISPRVEQMLTWLCALLEELTKCDSAVSLSLLSMNTFVSLQCLLSYGHENVKYTCEELVLNVLSLSDILVQQLMQEEIKGGDEKNTKLVCDLIKQLTTEHIDVCENKESHYHGTFTSHIIALAEKYSQTKYTTNKEQILTHCISLMSALYTVDHNVLTLQAIEQVQAICTRCTSSSSLTTYSQMKALAYDLQSKLAKEENVN